MQLPCPQESLQPSIPGQGRGGQVTARDCGAVSEDKTKETPVAGSEGGTPSGDTVHLIHFSILIC